MGPKVFSYDGVIDTDDRHRLSSVANQEFRATRSIMDPKTCCGSQILTANRANRGAEGGEKGQHQSDEHAYGEDLEVGGHFSNNEGIEPELVRCVS